MSDRISQFLGQKFVCPQCQSKLKFLRPPTRQLLTCPNCRRKLRLQEQAAAASQDDQIKEAIDSLVSWKSTATKPAYNYEKDPMLDRVDTSSPGIWKFDQPWPNNVHQVVMEGTEVACIPSDIAGTAQARKQMLDGIFRRVTVFRTGQVEEMAVDGHWWDFESHEKKVGILSRPVVRELNRVLTAKRFAARINSIQQTTRDNQEYFELFIDLAIDDSPKQKPITGDRVW